MTNTPQQFIAMWQGAHEESFGDKGVILTSSRKLVTALLDCGLSSDALILIARKAWKSNSFWCAKARSLKVFCERFDEIQAELAKPNSAPKVESHQMQEDIKVKVWRTGANGESEMSYE